MQKVISFCEASKEIEKRTRQNLWKRYAQKFLTYGWKALGTLWLSSRLLVM